MNRADLGRVIGLALDEDLDEGGLDADITTSPIVGDDVWGEAVVRAKAAGVVCGVEAIGDTFGRLDPNVVVTEAVEDGARVEPGSLIARVSGPVRPILVGERTALNLLGHLSGVATLASHFVEAAGDVEVVDTRKTMPGLRSLEKEAVRAGGGANHRAGLFDAVLVKDNHIVAAAGVGAAVRAVRAATDLAVQVECTDREEVDEALDAGATAVLLDNRDTRELKDLVGHIRQRGGEVMIEASGGITQETVSDVAATGVDRISVGALTHSAPALDVSLTLERTWRV